MRAWDAHLSETPLDLKMEIAQSKLDEIDQIVKNTIGNSRDALIRIAQIMHSPGV